MRMTRTVALPESRPPAAVHVRPLRERLARLVLPVFTALSVIYLFLPIAVMIAFSFNNPRGRQNITWQGFTFSNYLDIWNRPDVTGPMVTSLTVAVISTIIATTIGTLIGHGPHALPVPGPWHDQHPDLPADGDAGDHPRRLAAVAVGLPGRLSASLVTIIDRPRDVQHQLRGRHHPRPPAGLQPIARGGGHGPRCGRMDDVPQGHLPAHLPRHPGRGAARLRPLDRRLRHHLVRVGHHASPSRSGSSVSAASAYRPRSTCSARSSS